MECLPTPFNIEIIPFELCRLHRRSFCPVRGDWTRSPLAEPWNLLLSFKNLNLCQKHLESYCCHWFNKSSKGCGYRNVNEENSRWTSAL